MTKCNLVLVVPHDVHPRIFPWGVYHIRDYVQSILPDIDVSIWEIKKDSVIKDAIRNFEQSGKEVLPQLSRFTESNMNPIQMQLVSILNENPTLIEECDFPKMSIHAANNAKIQMKKALAEVKSAIQQRGRHMSPMPNDSYTVFGISVYDVTILESLYIGKALKESDPGNRIIFGGSYFYPENALEIIRNFEWVEAVIVGWGEEASVSIMKAISNDQSIDTVNMDGVCTRNRIFESTDSIGLSPIAACYQDSSTTQISCVNQADNEIHILPFHGCDWGKCTFCLSWARKFNYKVSSAVVINELRRKFSQTDKLKDMSQKQILISIDSDSTSVPELADILSALFLEILDERQTRRSILFYWQRVAQLYKHAARMTETLLQLQRRGVSLNPSLGIETLSPMVLKAMRKGSTALQHIFALKLMKDIKVGPIVFNYFLSFPSERLAGVEQEARILLQCLHLLNRPYVSYAFNKYIASEYDEIYLSQQHYGISVRPPTGNRWARNMGLNLVLSNYSTTYELIGYDEAERRWHETVYSKEFKQWAYAPHNSGDVRDAAWIDGLQKIIHKYNLHPAYVTRLQALAQPEIWWSNAWNEGKIQHASFELEGNTLRKNYPEPWSESWVMELNGIEFEVLKYLYKPRTKEEIIARFESDQLAHKLDEILTTHQRKGSILCIGERYLSLFNDPDGPKRLLVEGD